MTLCHHNLVVNETLNKRDQPIRLYDMNFFELMNTFPTEESVCTYFIKLTYQKDVPSCPHCGIANPSQGRSNRFWQCNECETSFSIFKGTIFEKTTTDLRKWMYAIHLFLNSKKGTSGYQLQREVGVTYKTAWRMLKQIRTAMGSKEREMVTAIVEMDETYIGGKPRPEMGKPREAKRGRGTKKTPVVGVVDRENNVVYAKVAKPNKEGKKLTGMQLFDVLNEAMKTPVELMAQPLTVITDEFRAYNCFSKKNIIRLSVDHKVMFSDNGINTNSVESFWATLKRGVYGIYHHVSVKYLQNYVNEFCFRWNNRKGNAFDTLLLGA